MGRVRLSILLQRRRRGSRLRLESRGQWTCRRNLEGDGLARIQPRSPRSEQADSREKILPGKLLDHHVLHGFVLYYLGLADKRRPVERANPHQHRTAAADSAHLPAVGGGVNQKLVGGGCDKPYRRSLALVAVFAHRRDIDVAFFLQRSQIGRRILASSKAADRNRHCGGQDGTPADELTSAEWYSHGPASSRFAG